MFDTISEVLHHLPKASSDRQPSQELQYDIFGGDPGRKFSHQLNPYHLGHSHVKRLACHRHRYVQSPRADGQHPHSAAGRGVTVGTQQGLPRNGKPFQMNLMTDSVSRSREVYPILRRHRLEESMIIGVFESDLKRIMIDIADGEHRFNPIDTQRLKLKVDHRSGGILS